MSIGQVLLRHISRLRLRLKRGRLDSENTYLSAEEQGREDVALNWIVG